MNKNLDNKDRKDINKNLSKNEEYLKNTIGQGFDINYRHFIIPAFDNCDALIINVNGMHDRREVEVSIVAPLVERFELPQNNIFAGKSKRISILLKSGVFIINNSFISRTASQ